MATKEQIKKVILEVAGNPISGVIFELAEDWANAIVAIDSPKPAVSSPAEKETRIIKSEEVR